MNKFILFTILFTTMGFFSSSVDAQTAKITKKMRAKPKSFTDYLSYFYWSDLRTGRLDSDVRGGTPDTYMYNMFNARYTFNPSHRINFQLRFGLTDEIDENGDRFDEDDTRVTYQGLLFKNKQTTMRITLGFQLPTSKGSQLDEDRIVRLKPNLIISHKIDDYNSLLVVPSYTRDIYSQSQGNPTETSKFYLGSWVAYSNKYLSDKYVFRADLETKHIQMAGMSDMDFKTTSFKLLVGVDCNIAGASIYPYLVQDTLDTTFAANRLGGGVQIFQVF